MAKRIKANGLFDVWSPDQVVECLDGVTDEIYTFIWNEIVPLYAKKKRSEWNDDFGNRCLKKYWSKIPDEFKVILNACAEKEKAKWDSYK